MLKKTAVLLMCSFALASCSNTDNVESTAADDAATDVAETKHIEPINLLIEETSEPTHQSQN